MIYYKKSNIKFFSPYTVPASFNYILTLYEDYEYTIPYYKYLTFVNRADELTRAERDLTNGISTDFYSKGRPDFCKSKY